jgi:carbon monoxide dehydrogenase subunit G
MKLEHEFAVPADMDTVWAALLDPERIAPCFLGATITSVDGDEFTGIVKVRLGPISLQYRGEGRFTGTDEAAHRTTIEASGAAAGGQGTAAAKVHVSLAENEGGTMVTVITDLTVTGKPAQFGRGLIEDVGKKIIGQFADCLTNTLGSHEEPEPVAEPAPSVSSSPGAAASPAFSAQARPAPVQPVQPRLVPPPMNDEIDLLETAGGRAVAKRTIPAAAALALLAFLLRRLRARRRTRQT